MTIKELQKKYGGWAAPGAKLKIGGKPVTDKRWNIGSIDCDVNLDSSAGMCTVSLEGMYDAKNSKFICEDSLVLGTPVEVEMGYAKTLPVFRGYLYCVDYSLSGDGSSSVTMTCMDVKAAMMGAGAVSVPVDATYKKLIDSFFAGETKRGYTELCKAPDISGLAELDEPLGFSVSEMDDYSILSAIARRFGLEFFIDGEKMVLRKKPTSSSPLLELSGLECISRVNTSFSTAGYVEKITVYGGTDDERDSEKKRAKATSKNDSQIAPKSSAAGRLIGSRKAEIFAANIRDDKSAAELAEAQMRARNEKLGGVSLTLQGIPDIKPGCYIKLSRVSPQIDGNLYVTSVNHSFGGDGYETAVKARREG